MISFVIPVKRVRPIRGSALVHITVTKCTCTILYTRVVWEVLKILSYLLYFFFLIRNIWHILRLANHGTIPKNLIEYCYIEVVRHVHNIAFTRLYSIQCSTVRSKLSWNSCDMQSLSVGFGVDTTVKILLT